MAPLWKMLLGLRPKKPRPPRDPAEPRRQGPLLLKQVHAVIDRRTTIICLDAAGQIQPIEDPFETLNGTFDHPPFHIHCRDVVVPWLPGFVSDERQRANDELRRRPLKQRRKGPGGVGARPVPLP